MPSGLIIVLMLVLWLVVLAPWLLRSQRPMSHTGEGFDETRVLFEGDSGRVQSRRPRMTEAQMRRVQHASAQPVDAEDEYDVVTADVDDEDILLDNVPTRAHSRAASSETEAAEGQAAEAASSTDSDTASGNAVKFDRGENTDADVDVDVDADSEADTVDGELVEELAAAPEGAGVARRLAHPEEDAADAEADSAADGETYELDESYTSPVDLMYPGAVDAEANAPVAGTDADVEADTADATAARGRVRAAESTDRDVVYVDEPAPEFADEQVGETDLYEPAESSVLVDGPLLEKSTSSSQSAPSARNAVKAERGGKEAELTEEELEFAMRRRGRGGWDPEADKRASADRYQRRRRTLLGLTLAAVITVVVGAILGGGWWILPAVAIAALAVYLFALRAQVRTENDLRARRIRQLRRARLGVRNAHDEELAIPRQLRRPGAVVVEADDESPDFDYLPVYTHNFDGDFDGQGSRPRGRGRVAQRDDLAARRVG